MRASRIFSRPGSAASTFVLPTVFIIVVAAVSALTQLAEEASGASVAIHSPGEGEVFETNEKGFQVLLSANFPKQHNEASDNTHMVCLGVDGEIQECFSPSLMQRDPEDGRNFLGLQFSSDILRSLHDRSDRRLRNGGGSPGDQTHHVLFAAILSNLAIEGQNLEEALARAELNFYLSSPGHDDSENERFNQEQPYRDLAMQHVHADQPDTPPRRPAPTPDRYEAQWGNVSALLPSWPLPCTHDELKVNQGFPSLFLANKNRTRPVVVASWIKWFDSHGFDEQDIATCSVPCLFVHIPSTDVRQECTDQVCFF
jgi:hypothetical protein